MRFAVALATLTAAAGITPFTTTAFAPVTVSGPSRSAPSVVRMAPSDVCVVSDPRAIELSGLILGTKGYGAGSGYIAINDSQDNSDNIRVIYLDAGCKVTATLRYPTPARDPEDVAVSPDGTVWVADIGDNATSQTRRQNVALWKVPPGGGAPVIHRLTYPDGPHDAEALLFNADGTPVIVTKETTGEAGIYVPTAALQPQSATGVALKRVGQFAPRATGENNLLGALGETMITGAATSPDRHRVALRTYTAAYEWDVPDGDVVKALTKSTPRLTALPDEPQGESIAYSSDGKSFLTLSDEQGPTTMRAQVPSSQPLAPPPATLSPTPDASKPTGLAALPIWYSVGAGVGGLALLFAGVLGVRRGRKDPDAEPPAGPAPLAG